MVHSRYFEKHFKLNSSHLVSSERSERSPSQTGDRERLDLGLEVEFLHMLLSLTRSSVYKDACLPAYLPGCLLSGRQTRETLLYSLRSKKAVEKPRALYSGIWVNAHSFIPLLQPYFKAGLVLHAGNRTQLLLSWSSQSCLDDRCANRAS